MMNLADSVSKNGYNVYTCCKASKESLKHKKEGQLIFGYRIERIISNLLSNITGLHDHFNFFGTISFVNKLKKINPDLVHLHVLHDNIINIRILFNYLSKANIPVIWTFHDCTAFTGKCSYFDISDCNKWMKCCNNCPQKHNIPNSLLFDTSKLIYNYRKKYFTKLNNLTIVTPSNWLANLVSKSFFSKYPVKVINNGIDLNVFKYMENDFKVKNNINNKFVVLGVANVWSERKGLDVFIKLANDLPDNFQIILVGTNGKVDRLLPKNIISIHRTYNQTELVKIYSAADLFVNPTREENFPTVNIEALACGLPVITYDTGGSPEIIDENSGVVVKKDDYKMLKKDIIDLYNKNINKNNCINRSQKYNKNSMYTKYIKLYNRIIH